IRLWRFAIANHHRTALRSSIKKQRRKVIWHADTTVTGRITRKLSRVHGDAAPGEPLHVRHRSVIIRFRVMRFLLLENVEYPRWCGVALSAAADARAADENAVAIQIHRLLRQAYQHDDRPARRKSGLPPVLARLERASRLASWHAFGVEGRLIHREGSGDKRREDGNDRLEFHRLLGESTYRYDCRRLVPR